MSAWIIVNEDGLYFTIQGAGAQYWSDSPDNAIRFARRGDAVAIAKNILGPHPRGKEPYTIFHTYRFVDGQHETSGQVSQPQPELSASRDLFRTAKLGEEKLGDTTKAGEQQGFHDALLEGYLDAADKAPIGSLKWLLRWFANSLDEAMSRNAELERRADALDCHTKKLQHQANEFEHRVGKLERTKTSIPIPLNNT